ncbi:MAG: exonuclease domain-containing protein [Chromatiales bacterium]|nr:exonuclease domain-containing protein [Chromatiales bacterium]
MLLHSLRRRWLASRLSDNPLKAFYQIAMPQTGNGVDGVEFLSLDLETTGFDSRHETILSVGWVVLDSRRILLGSGEHHLIKPSSAINESSAVIHAITDDMAAGGEELCEVMARLLQVLQGRVLLAHNAVIERRFLDRACRHCFGGPFRSLTVDTLQLALRRLRQRDQQPRGGELRLGALREEYGLPRYRAHNALTDALATAELFLAQLAHRAKGGDTALREILS